MNVIKKISTPDFARGTSLVGYITTTYDEIVNAFGEPNYGPSGDNKVQSEWVLDVNGEPCTIYDWKVKETPKELYKWHVGGRSATVLIPLAEAFGWKISRFLI
jgi:hypothetical protein